MIQIKGGVLNRYYRMRMSLNELRDYGEFNL